MNETEIAKMSDEMIYLDGQATDELNRGYYIVKRSGDIFISMFGCILLIPIALVIKIACLITRDNAAIMFKQERIGKDGKPIYIYKFRSMVPDADKKLEQLLETNEEIRREYKRFKKIKNDPRITRVGKLIRDTSIDEIPQFINVLKGDMSLVGPRPYLYREKEDMGEYYDAIISCKPGITGYWQVNGRSGTDFIKRLVMDEYYFKTRGLTMDSKIFAKTFIKVAKKDGAK